MLLAPASAMAGMAGRATAVRIYMATSGDRAGELEVRVIARYPARDVDAGGGPFYGYTGVDVQGPGGTLRLHDLDRLAHPRHAEQFDHRIEITRSRARHLLGTRRNARLRVTTRSVVLGPLARSTRATEAALARAPRVIQSLTLREVATFSPTGGRLIGSPRGSLTITYALEPGTDGTYDPIVSLQPPVGRALMPSPIDGLLSGAPAGEAPFSATFAFAAPLPGGCSGSASGTIDGIVAGLGGALDFTDATFSARWSSMDYAWPVCEHPVSGAFASIGQTWMQTR